MTIIRNAREEEARLLAAIGYRAWQGAVAGPGEAEALGDIVEAAFTDFAARHWLTIDVAEKAAQIIGWASRQKLDNVITDLWVEPVFQRMGTGSLLLSHVEAEIVRLGYDEALIETQEDNRAALAFLTGHGYRVRSLTTTWSARLDRDVDVLQMVKELAPVEAVREGPESRFI